MAVGRGDQHAQAHAARAGFLESLDLAHTDGSGEFVAFADGHFGVGCARLHGFRNNIGGKLLKIVGRKLGDATHRYFPLPVRSASATAALLHRKRRRANSHDFALCVHRDWAWRRLRTSDTSRSRLCIPDIANAAQRASGHRRPEWFSTHNGEIHPPRKQTALHRQLAMEPSFSDLSSGAAYRHAIQLYRRHPDADRHALAIFAASTYAFVEFEIVADHGDILKSFGTVADQRGVADRGGDFAVFDQVSLGGGE